MSEVLTARVRDSRGKRNARRMRHSGQTPAVLYGHGKESISLVLPTDEITSAIRHGGKLVELKGDVSDSVIIRDLQWDVFGNEVLHVDFMRVDADERLAAEVAVELRGESPGTREGGVVQHLLHFVKIEAAVASIPDKLHVNINSLQLGQVLTAADIEDMPSDAKLLIEADRVIVQCVVPAVETEEEVEGETAEPEVIGSKDDEGEEAKS